MVSDKTNKNVCSSNKTKKKRVAGEGVCLFKKRNFLFEKETHSDPKRRVAISKCEKRKADDDEKGGRERERERRMQGKRICLFPHPSQQHDFFYRHLTFSRKEEREREESELDVLKVFRFNSQ